MSILGIGFCIAFWLAILMVILQGIGTLILKFIEQVTEGRLKFFNRDYFEPIYSKWPRPVEFF